MYKFISNDNIYQDYEIVETQTFQKITLFENNSIIETSKLFSKTKHHIMYILVIQD